MTEGEQVTLRAFRGQEIIRTVVRDLGEVIMICKPEEFAAANAEKREPVSVGFPKTAIINGR